MRSKRPSSSTVYVRISSKEDSSDQVHKTYYDTTPHAVALILDHEAERGDNADAAEDAPAPLPADSSGSVPTSADAASPTAAGTRTSKATTKNHAGKGN